jgi:hypothetical protein
MMEFEIEYLPVSLRLELDRVEAPVVHPDALDAITMQIFGNEMPVDCKQQEEPQIFLA